MLRLIGEVTGYVLAAEDGEIGRCKDFLFDDTQWAVRYMVADTRKWLPGRKVLISPISLGEPDWDTRRFHVNLTKEQVKHSPPLAEEAPVSRQYEMNWFDYYGWPYYWGAGGLWGAAPYPSALYLKRLEKTLEKETDPEETHIRSVKEVKGYDIQASDGNIGHVDDFILDDESWRIRYLVADTGHWLSGRKVLFAPEWVTQVDWPGMAVWLDVSKNAIETSPEFDPNKPLERSYEARLHEHYGRTFQ
jgi:hypothetical protein